MVLLVEAPVCCHHWMIQPADGPVSLGVCQKCFETKEFKNTIEEEWSFDGPTRQRTTIGELLDD